MLGALDVSGTALCSLVQTSQGGRACWTGLPSSMISDKKQGPPGIKQKREGERKRTFLGGLLCAGDPAGPSTLVNLI